VKGEENFGEPLTEIKVEFATGITMSAKALEKAMKKFLLGSVMLAVTHLAWGGEVLEVYKSPTCGCCTDWVEYMRDNGFEVEVHDTQNMHPIKVRAGIQPGQGSCHTGFIGGYTIEGHVPAEDVKRLLKEKPDARGLTVPGMPMGSPGMEGPRKDDYSVLLFRDDGPTSVFAEH
jgi:hypothetical protein